MSDTIETIQEIAYKLMLEQNKNEVILGGPTERTTFVLGSKGVVSKCSDILLVLHSIDNISGKIHNDQQLS
jgi:hypothetical protein